MDGTTASEKASEERQFLEAKFLYASGSVVSKAMVPGTLVVKLLKMPTNRQVYSDCNV
jgi:hypothetical protein